MGLEKYILGSKINELMFRFFLLLTWILVDELDMMALAISNFKLTISIGFSLIFSMDTLSDKPFRNDPADIKRILKGEMAGMDFLIVWVAIGGGNVDNRRNWGRNRCGGSKWGLNNGSITMKENDEIKMKNKRKIVRGQKIIIKKREILIFARKKKRKKEKSNWKRRKMYISPSTKPSNKFTAS